MHVDWWVVHYQLIGKPQQFCSWVDSTLHHPSSPYVWSYQWTGGEPKYNIKGKGKKELLVAEYIMPTKSDVGYIHYTLTECLTFSEWLYILGIPKRGGYRDQIVSMSVSIWATEYVFISCIPQHVWFIVHDGIKWLMNTSICSQCPILFPCFSTIPISLNS